MIKESPKIIIVGGGPVGCYLGQLLKHYGFNPLILEEDPEIGRPVACAGIVGKNVFTDTLLPISKKSVINTIDGAKMTYNGSSFLLKRPSVAYIICRDIFDKELSQGLNIELNTRLLDVKMEGTGHRLHTTNGEYYADILIGADGPHSKVRNSLKFKSDLKIHAGLQYRIKVDIPDIDRVAVSYVKPFSMFNWIIPEGNGVIRVGTVATRPVEALAKFMKENNINGEILEKNIGPIPIGICDLVNGNAALVGDAGCQVKPITSGGIFYGMKSAEILAKSIKDGNLPSYQTEWDREFGKEIKTCLLIRYIMENIDKDVLEKAFNYVKENSSVLEKVGDFENHSSVLWTLAANFRTYPTIGAVAMGIIKNPKILFRVLRGK